MFSTFRRWISLHASFFLRNWTAYLAIFIAAFVDRAHSSWYLLSMLAAAVTAVITRRRQRSALPRLLILTETEPWNCCSLPVLFSVWMPRQARPSGG